MENTHTSTKEKTEERGLLLATNREGKPMEGYLKEGTTMKVAGQLFEAFVGSEVGSGDEESFQGRVTLDDRGSPISYNNESNYSQSIIQSPKISRESDLYDAGIRGDEYHPLILDVSE